MGLLSKLFGGVKEESPSQNNDYAISSHIASLIDGVISTQGFSELEKPNTAVVIDSNNRIGIIWSSNLKIGDKVKSFVYLNELYEFEGLKGAFGFDVVKGMSAKDAKDIMEMMGGMLGTQAVDKLAIAALHELKRKIT